MDIETINKTKICSKCGQEKCLNQFYTQHGSKMGIHSWCKKCKNKSSQEKYKKRQYKYKCETKLDIGNKYGGLTIISEKYKSKEHGGSYYIDVECECGEKFSIYIYNLLKNKTYCKKCTARIISEKNKEIHTKVGEKHNSLTIIEPAFLNRDKNRWVVKCKCDCGCVKIYDENRFSKGLIKSCGCKNIKHNFYIGQIINNLTILDANYKDHNKSRMIKVKCNCGTEFLTDPTRLSNGQKGCKKCSRSIPRNKTHGMSNHRLYRIWQGIKYRCYAVKDKRYKYYGGKGIIVCDEWKNSFIQFKNWALSHGYKDNLTIDRIDPDKNYEPSNCEWVTASENSSRVTVCRKEKYKKLTKENNELKQQVLCLILLLCNKV